MARVSVRIARPADAVLAGAAARLIRAAARDHDIAVRSAGLLRQKIAAGAAALALAEGELIGFGYFSAWEGGRFVSHSGLVVRDAERGLGIGRRLKECLFRASRRLYPGAATMSLTSSQAVMQLNRSLGFRRVPLERLTKDPEFWKGCRTCRNYAAVVARGERCCCAGMLRR